MRRAFLSVLSISLTLATACGTPPRIDPVPQVRNGDAALQTQYEAALERWTRRAELYDRLDARLFIAGTLLSPTFRDALSARDSSLGIPPSPLLSPKPGEFKEEYAERLTAELTVPTEGQKPRANTVELPNLRIVMEGVSAEEFGHGMSISEMKEIAALYLFLHAEVRRRLAFPERFKLRYVKRKI